MLVLLEVSISRAESYSESTMQIELSYLADNPIYKEEKPYTLFLPSLEKDTKTTNCEYVVHDGIPVEDARGREAEFNLDSCGFAFLEHKSQQHCSCKDFESIENGESVVMPYLRECVQVLKSYLNPTRVLCFDWRVSVFIYQGTSDVVCLLLCRYGNVLRGQ